MADPRTSAGRFLKAGLMQLLGWDEVAAHNAIADIEDEARAGVLPPGDVPLMDAADRTLAVPHRYDDQACGCDSCMDYGAEDEGINWSRLTPARRIALRVLDSGDDRLAELATTIREHEDAVRAASDSGYAPGLREALRDLIEANGRLYVRTYRRAYGTGGGATDDEVEDAAREVLEAVDRGRAALAETPGEPE